MSMWYQADLGKLPEEGQLVWVMSAFQPILACYRNKKFFVDDQPQEAYWWAPFECDTTKWFPATEEPPLKAILIVSTLHKNDEILILKKYDKNGFADIPGTVLAWRFNQKEKNLE